MWKDNNTSYDWEDLKNQVQGRVLFDGIDISNLPPYKREINTVFQKYALFPHMNVFDNIAFGLKIKCR